MLKNILSILFFLIIIFILPKPADAATATGTLESEIFDAGTGVNWGEMSWTASTSASSTITMKVRTGTTTDMASAPDWDDCTAVTSGADISANDCVSDGDRFIQYYAWLENEYYGTSTYATPEISEVKIKYEAVGILMSSPYDTLADDTVLDEIRWSETLPAGTDILIQLRTSADGSAWSDWLGPDGTAYDYFTDPEGGDSLPSALADGSGERYFQYRAILDSGGQDFPILSSLEIDFTASVPVITSLSPDYIYSNASGTVAVLLSGSNFLSGATLAVESGGSSFTISDKTVSADSISFNLDSSVLFGGPAEITITNPNGAYAVWSDFYVNEYRGTYVSEARELPNLSFGALSWSAATSATSSIAVKFRTDSASDMSGADAWGDCPYAESGIDVSGLDCVSDGHRYVQYRLKLAAVYGTSTAWLTPEFSDITLAYDHYAATGTLISSPYDSSDNDNRIRAIRWIENTPAGTDIIFQIRTAPDAAGAPGIWSDWLGLMGADDWYRNADGKNTIHISHTDGRTDRWFQYRVKLESDGLDSPILSGVDLEYGSPIYSEVIIKDGQVFGDGVIFR
jgi:hypothetical protein